MRPEPTGWTSWITTTDHKRIGILYLWTVAVFFVLGGVEALLIRVQLGAPDNTLLSPEKYNQLFTMHGTTMIFLVVVPVWAGLANYLLPLMIGARDVAFPRLNAWSYWMFLFGGIALYASFFWTPPEAGWFSYVPLSTKEYSPSGGQDAWIFMVHLTGLSSMLGAVNFIATIHNMRAPGMGWGRLPLFVWTILIYSYLIVLALSSLAATVTMLLLDRHFGTNFFDPTEGGSALLWQHLFWFFGHPEVYIFVLPAFGVFSEVLPVFARKPIFGYKAIAAATAGIAFLGLLVWAHHMFATPSATVVLAFFMLSSFVIAVPTGVKIFNWIATLWRGTIEFRVALLYAVGGIGTFVIGGITGIFLAVFPVDWQLTDTYFVVAHMHYVAFGGSAFAMFAALYYWFPKMTGPDALRGARQGLVLAHADRLPHDLPRAALGRPERHAAAHLRVPGGLRLARLQPDLDDRRVHPRARASLLTIINVVRSLKDGAVAGPGPVEGEHARVVHALAAARAQLRLDPARALGRADEGHTGARSRSSRARSSASRPAGRWRTCDAAVEASRITTHRRSGRPRRPAASARSSPTTSTLTKPKVQSLLLLTTVTTMYVAGDPSLALVFWTVPRRLARRRAAPARSTTGTTATSTRRWRARPRGRCPRGGSPRARR